MLLVEDAVGLSFEMVKKYTPDLAVMMTAHWK
jgi:hypothetical protein